MSAGMNAHTALDTPSHDDRPCAGPGAALARGGVLPVLNRPARPMSDAPAVVREGLGRLDRALMGVLARGWRVGTLALDLPDGSCRLVRGAQPGGQARLVLHRPRALWRLALGGVIGLAEAYIDGDWDSPDLAAFLELGDRNDPAAVTGAGSAAARLAHRGQPLARALAWLRHRRNDNNRQGSRRNISAHYDLGNDFYAAWLDSGMTYSAALFEDGVTDLATAQDAKYRALARDLGLRPGMRVLEIGCGWGGFAHLAATEFGVEVVGLTLSHEQHAYATARMARSGLADRVEIRLQDYRDTTGHFDAIVSIEMVEAVGERWWPVYFRTLRDRLRPGGLAALQAITIAPDRYERYRRGCDFIQRHVFPGGMLPTQPGMAALAAGTGLDFSIRRRFGADYERTLGLWAERFTQASDLVAAQGYPERLRRLWDFYLAYCRAGFRTGTLDVCHVLMRRPA